MFKKFREWQERRRRKKELQDKVLAALREMTEKQKLAQTVDPGTFNDEQVQIVIDDFYTLVQHKYATFKLDNVLSALMYIVTRAAVYNGCSKQKLTECVERMYDRIEDKYSKFKNRVLN